MNTYNALSYSVYEITTNLQLYFELTQHVYPEDTKFAERWNKHIIEMVKEKLWEYSRGVMMNKSLGDELYKGSLDVMDLREEYTLREAIEFFAKTNEELGDKCPIVWKNGSWVEEEAEVEEDCDDCPQCGKGLTDLYHKEVIGDMICDACYEDQNEDQNEEHNEEENEEWMKRCNNCGVCLHMMELNAIEGNRYYPDMCCNSCIELLLDEGRIELQFDEDDPNRKYDTYRYLSFW
jgi:hypothetical protein